MKQRFVPHLAEYLKDKGLLELPRDENLPGWSPNRPPKRMEPIIKGGKPVPRLTLGNVSIALGSTRPELREFSQSSGLDLSAVKEVIDKGTLDRNRATHETGIQFAETSRLREDWLGVPGSGGIFGALLPKGG